MDPHDLLHLSSPPDLSNPSIKLFGQMIPSDSNTSFPPHTISDRPSAQDGALLDPDENSLSPRGVEELGMSSGSTSNLSDEADESSRSRGSFEHQAAMPIEDPKEEESKAGGTSKRLCRPKNLVPCPRCNSSDTKFCYFNNYNINQPRHFCKSCERYWTAGGMLRNVRVGAGRRKNKHASQQKQSFLDNVVMSRLDLDGAQPLISCSDPQVCSLNPSLHVSLPSSRQEIGKYNRVVADSRNGQSSTVYDGLIQAEAKSVSDLTGFRNPPTATTQPKEECGSMVPPASELTSNSSCDGKNMVDGRSVVMLPTSADSPPAAGCCAFPFFAPPWPYLYMAMASAAAAASAAGNASQGATNIPPWVGQWPALQGGMWNPQSWHMPWNLQWGSPATAVAATTAAAGLAPSNADYPIKRPRASHGGIGNSSLCIPKTLRIHDAEAAARSSILTTLGVDNESETLRSGGIFQPKAEVFQPRPGNKICRDERGANPAAISRSMTFQESN